MRSAAFILLLAALLSACSREMDTTIQAANVKATLDTLWTQYAVAADQRDSIAFGSLFHEDAALVFPQTPTITGRSAIENFLVTHYSAIDVTALRITPEDLRVNGTLAAQSGSFEEDDTQAGVKGTLVGRFTLIAEQGTDRVWRIRRLVTVADSMRKE